MTGGTLADALEGIDRALAARPKLDGDALTDAMKALCRQRDDLRRSGVARGELKAINGLISLVHAAHFPTDAIPWTLLEQARSGVVALAADL